MANSLYWGVLVEFIFWMLNSHVHFFVIVVVVSVIYVIYMLTCTEAADHIIVLS